MKPGYFVYCTKFPPPYPVLFTRVYRVYIFCRNVYTKNTAQ